VARYRYAGDGPHDDGRGGLVRPGDEWDWPAEPDWGPWELLDGAEGDSPGPGAQAPAPGAGSPGAAQDAPPAASSAAADDPGTEG
jgi:hypothetical protein